MNDIIEQTNLSYKMDLFIIKYLHPSDDSTTVDDYFYETFLPIGQVNRLFWDFIIMDLSTTP
jgi:hypothetical protein